MEAFALKTCCDRAVAKSRQIPGTGVSPGHGSNPVKSWARDQIPGTGAKSRRWKHRRGSRSRGGRVHGASTRAGPGDGRSLRVEGPLALLLIPLVQAFVQHSTNTPASSKRPCSRQTPSNRDTCIYIYAYVYRFMYTYIYVFYYYIYIYIYIYIHMYTYMIYISLTS